MPALEGFGENVVVGRKVYPAASATLHIFGIHVVHKQLPHLLFGEGVVSFWIGYRTERTSRGSMSECVSVRERRGVRSTQHDA